MSLDKRNIYNELEKGYKEMAEINAELAESAIEADNECLEQYEKELTECEQ